MKAISSTLISIFFLLGIVLTARAQTANDALLLEYYQGQRYVEAANYLKGVYKEPVNDQVALRNLAYTSQMAGKLVDAESYYTRLFNIDSTKLSVLNSLAGINLRRGNLNKAGYYYKQIIAKDTANFYVLTQLANISSRNGDTVNFSGYLIKANQINPEDADVASDLSDWYVSTKKFKPAEEVLSKAIAVDSQNVTLLQSLILLTHKQKKWPETIKVGLQLLQLGDGTFQTALKLGQAYYMLKNYTCCLEVLANLQANQQTESSYYFMGMSYKGLKNYTKAIKYFELAIKDGISPSIPTYYGEMAGSYQENKHLKKAVWAYQKGLTFDEDNAMIFYSLATIYDTDLKDRASAVKYFKKYLGTHPPLKQQALIDYTKSRITALAKPN